MSECVFENEGIQLFNGLWWCVCVTKLTGRDFVFFSLWMWWISTITAICVFYFLVSVWVYIVWRHFFTRSAITVWCVCEYVCLLVNLQNTFPFVFFSSPKGLSGFRFHLFKKFVSIVFPSYNYLLCFFFSLLSARTLIKHTLSALKTLNSLLFITQWSSRHHLYYCV